MCVLAGPLTMLPSRVSVRIEEGYLAPQLTFLLNWGVWWPRKAEYPGYHLGLIRTGPAVGGGALGIPWRAGQAGLGSRGSMEGTCDGSPQLFPDLRGHL